MNGPAERVLVADDEGENIRSLGGLLGEQGLEVGLGLRRDALQALRSLMADRGSRRR